MVKEIGTSTIDYVAIRNYSEEEFEENNVLEKGKKGKKEKVLDYVSSFFRTQNDVKLQEGKCTSCSLADYESLYEVVLNAKAHVSFWGARYITPEGGSSQWNINEIIGKLNGLMNRNLEFCEKERQIGRRIVSKIDHLIIEDKRAYYNSGFLTRILYSIRKLFYVFSGFNYKNEIRWELRYNTEHGFERYTRNQYIKVFGIKPPSSEKIKDRWLAPTDRKA